MNIEELTTDAITGLGIFNGHRTQKGKEGKPDMNFIEILKLGATITLEVNQELFPAVCADVSQGKLIKGASVVTYHAKAGLKADAVNIKSGEGKEFNFVTANYERPALVSYVIDQPRK